MRASVEKGREDQGELSRLITGYGRLFAEADQKGCLLGQSLFKTPSSTPFPWVSTTPA